ncbi:MAG: hypothetical protein NTW87_36945 [Planctomycetota bacterium]|nr:hypothetical protein [Planctomycetota bacterium]
MRSRRIAAFYNGHCRVCGKAVPKGEDCYFAKHYGIRCLCCGPHTALDERLPSKRHAMAARKSEPASTPSMPAKPRLTEAPDPRFTPLDESPDFNPQDHAAVRCEDGVHRIEFGSIREIVEDALSDYAQNDPNRERIRDARDMLLSGSERQGNYFTRRKLLDEVFNPPAELLSAVDRMREKIIGELDLPTRQRRKLRRNLDWGDEMDVDRWAARDLSMWERVERAPEPRRTVTIGCNISVNHHQAPEELLYRGAAALALADILTERGCNVQVILFETNGSPSSAVETGLAKCVVKAADMPLDLGAIAFAMCEIAFNRCAVIMASARHWPGTLRSGFGHSREAPAQDRANADFFIENDVRSEAAAVEWLRARVGEGCHV